MESDKLIREAKQWLKEKQIEKVKQPKIDDFDFRKYQSMAMQQVQMTPNDIQRMWQSQQTSTQFPWGASASRQNNL